MLFLLFSIVFNFPFVIKNVAYEYFFLLCGKEIANERQKIHPANVIFPFSHLFFYSNGSALAVNMTANLISQLTLVRGEAIKDRAQFRMAFDL